LLTAKGFSFALADGRVLFHNLHFTIENKKYGLVGINGVGKSTLVKLISRELRPTDGKILGEELVTYLPQWEQPPDMVAGEYLVDIWENTEPFLRESLLKDLDLSLQLSQLSGGQWMRVRLLRALAKAGGILIFDEPTNNLDREARESLYHFVEIFKGTLLVISHDRELLGHVDEIWELSNQGLAVYGGNFDFYDQQKQSERSLLNYRIDIARREKKKQEREHIEKIDKQLKRTRVAAKNAKDAGLPKILLGARKRKAQVSLGKIESREQERDSQRKQEFQHLYEKQKQSSDLRMNISLGAKPKGKVILNLDQFNCRYLGSEKWLWKSPLSFTLLAGERLVLSGGNGSGKSTLLKILTGELTSEKCDWVGRFSGITREFVYLDQDYGMLNYKQNIIDNLMNDCGLELAEARNRLADFGFTGEDVFKMADVLSGGERLRLSLAKLALALKPRHLWILDEPSNNLDLESLMLLERSLREYDGTLILVSHDKYFIEKVGCGQCLKLVSAQNE